MSRFMQELSGKFGPYWKDSAEKELKQIKSDISLGIITIDEHGIARNCVGRALMNDMIEKVALVSDKISVQATMKAREDEVGKDLIEYRDKMKSYVHTEEDLYEMRAAFGDDTTIVDVLSGQTIKL